MDTILIVISIVLAATTAFFGYKWKQVKSLLKDFVIAVEDDKISEEEYKSILADIKSLFNM
jgi:flagellar motor component MotA